ncbi:hypothetical protein [Frankia gtarii]|uniref:hypothetical protein n=1 Tax=Frankia gtarii TaxID=2950102 RepID=UPI0021C0D1DD|nr:hypothetical protein [Frankia gtarii]
MSAEPVDPTGDAAAGRDPERPSPPDPHPAADADATRPVDADSGPGTEPGAPEPTDDDRKSTRPLDWDGSFSRIWNARYGRDWTNQLAAEQTREWEDEQFERFRQETVEQVDAESAREEARLREEQERSTSTGGQSAQRSAREELLRKLDKLDRLAPPHVDEPGAVDGQE